MTGGKTVAIDDHNDNQLLDTGEKAFYTILVFNKGNERGGLVTVQDSLENLLPYIKDNGTSPVTIRNLETDAIVGTYTVNGLKAGFTFIIYPDTDYEISFDVELKDDFDEAEQLTLVNTAYVNEIPYQAEVQTSIFDYEAVKNMINISDSTLDYVRPGDKIQVVISAKNTGQRSDTLFVQDELTDLLDYIDLDPTVPVSVNAGGVESTITLQELMDGVTYNIDPEDRLTFIFELKLKDVIEFEGTLTLSNIALVGDKKPDDEIDLKEAKIIARKYVEDADEDEYVQSGEVVSYTLTAENVGSAPFKGLLIQDEMADLIGLVDFDPSDAIITTSGDYTLQDLMDGFYIDLNEGDMFEVVFSVIAKDNIRELLGDDKYLRNQAVIGEETPETEIPFGDYGVDGRKLVTGTVHEAIVFAGEGMNYTIEVWNTKDLMMEDVVIKDALNFILDFIEDPTDTPLRISSSVTDRVFDDYTVEDLQRGLVLDVDVGETITIDFVVYTLTTLTKEDITILNNTVSINTHDRDASIPLGEMSFNVEKRVSSAHPSGYAVPGYDVYYEIIVHNTGDGAYRDIEIKDTLEYIMMMIDDPTLDPMDYFVVITRDDLPSIEAATIADMMDGYLFSIESGETVTFSFAVKVRSDLNISIENLMHNVATVNELSDDADIEIRNAILQLEKDVEDANGDGFASSLETLHYTITASNTGTLGMADLVVRDTLEYIYDYIDDPDANVLYITSNLALDSIETTVSALREGITIDLEPGENIQFTFDVTLAQDAVARLLEDDLTDLRNTATLEDIPATTEIPAKDPELLVSKRVFDANEDGFAQAGEILGYRIEIENISEANAEGVWVVDTLEDILDYIENPDLIMVHVSGSDLDQTMNLSRLREGFEVDVPAGTEVAIYFEVQVRTDLNTYLEENVRLENTVLVNEKPTTVDIPTYKGRYAAEKLVFEDNNDGLVQAHETLRYNIIITNTGLVSVENLFVKDDLKDLLDLVDIDLDQVIRINGEESLYTMKDLMEGFLIDLEVDAVLTLEFSVGVKETLDFKDPHHFKNVAHVGEEEVPAEIDSEVIVEVPIEPEEPQPEPEKPVPVEPVPVVPTPVLPQTGITQETIYRYAIAIIMAGAMILGFGIYFKRRYKD